MQCVRLDLKSEYETSEEIFTIMNLIVPPTFDLFECEEIITKVPVYAVERIEAMKRVGFKKSTKLLVGTMDGWLPDDAPAPDPNSEISIVHFYINEDGETIVYDPETEVIPYSTAYGDAGTAAIYWVNRSQIYWGITSYTKGLMTFAGDVTTNRGGFYLLGDIEFDGSASGNIMGVTTKRGTNTATLSGFMIDAKGVSFTAPDVSSSLTY